MFGENCVFIGVTKTAANMIFELAKKRPCGLVGPKPESGLDIALKLFDDQRLVPILESASNQGKIAFEGPIRLRSISFLEHEETGEKFPYFFIMWGIRFHLQCQPGTIRYLLEYELHFENAKDGSSGFRLQLKGT